MKGFTHDYISSRIIRIKDCADVFSYLVTGEKFSCLLDTGSGFDDIKGYVHSLTDKPLLVALTHGHLDHCGGAGLFDVIYMNHKDLTVLKRDNAVAFRYKYYQRDEILSKIARKDYNPEIMLSKVRHIEDNQIFDLGGICIQMISIPGHTPGMMCALIKEERIMLFGDACGVFVMLFDEYSSTVEEYHDALLKLKSFEPAYDKIIRNHGTGLSEKAVLHDVLECTKRVLNRSDDKVPFTFMNTDLLISAEIDQAYNRKDGREGNFAYKEDRIYK